MKVIKRIVPCVFGLLLFVPLVSCSSKGKSIIGHYKSREHGFLAKNYLYFFQNAVYPLGSSLKIRPDSTYRLQTCGNIIDGKWRVQGDTLLLFCESNKWRIDSLNKIHFTINGKSPDCGTGPEIFIIDGNSLKQKFYSKKMKRTVLNYLDKVEKVD